MSEPWQCPACRTWLAPGTLRHSCDDVAPVENDVAPDARGIALDVAPDASANGHGASSPVAQEVLGSKVQSSAPKSKSKQPGYTPDFELFWSLYPLHRDKRKAFNAWRNATLRQTQEVINAGATRYCDDPNRVAQYTKYAEGWLNADGWEDDPLPVRSGGLLPSVRPPDPAELDNEFRQIAEDAERRLAGD